MATAAEVMNHKLTAVILTATIMGSALSYMDSRHASAMDVSTLTEVLETSEIARMEYQIQESERRIKRLKRTPEEDREVFEQDDLEDLEVRKEYLLRELDRMERK